MSYLSRIIYNIPHGVIKPDRKFSTNNVEKNPESGLCFVADVENQTAKERAPRWFSTSSPKGFFHAFVDKGKGRIERAVWR